MLPLIGAALILQFSCGGGPTASFPTLAVTTTALPNAAPGVAYSAALSAIGGDGSYTWSRQAGSLPAGLTLAANGDVTGTPTAAETGTFTVQVASGDGQTATQQLTLTVDLICSDLPGSALASFEDANLETVIRGALQIGAQDDLTCALVSGLTILDNGSSAGIVSLEGMQNLTSLTILVLIDNSITDAGPLSSLPSLQTIFLRNNSIRDLSPFTGLTGLGTLVLGNNSISDLSPLTGLTSLWDLDVANNSITDISTLAGLTGMTKLYLNGNNIRDIDALAGLLDLGDVDLDDNANLADLRALLDNPAFGVGAQLFVRSTAVSCTDVAALKAKGVSVFSDCL